MEIGISTASLFGRLYNEDALPLLEKLGAKIAEVFLETYCEYTESFANLLKERKGELKIHSVHTLNTHFEPQLFSDCERTKKDAIGIFEKCLKAGRILGASCYTMHGKARFKRNINYDNYEKIGEHFCSLTKLCSKYGISLTLENVEWAYYNKPGFFKNVKKYCADLYSCLDVKQARESGFSYKEYIEEMGDSLLTVHLSDVDKNGRTAIPSKNGKFDFEELFKILKYNGFKGDCLIEIYKENFKTYDELAYSLDYLREIKSKYF